jgi:hypothetical protein
MWISQNTTITTMGTTHRTRIAIQSAAVSSASPDRNDAWAKAGREQQAAAADAARGANHGHN